MQPNTLALPPKIQGRIERLGFLSILYGGFFGYLNARAAVILLMRGFHGNNFDLGKVLMAAIALASLFQVVTGIGLSGSRSGAVRSAYRSYAVLFLCGAVGLLLNLCFWVNVTIFPMVPLAWSIFAFIVLRSCRLDEPQSANSAE